MPDIHFSHEGERCSFDPFLKHCRLTDPALDQLAQARSPEATTRRKNELRDETAVLRSHEA
ncbi:MAG: chromate resistance protein [Betaproteobacteria bacterium]|nr:MAG: chromate resistance protein [Betaproteobacteria bacterium]